MAKLWLAAWVSTPTTNRYWSATVVALGAVVVTLDKTMFSSLCSSTGGDVVAGVGPG
jgi:hypothetical protein